MAGTKSTKASLVASMALCVALAPAAAQSPRPYRPAFDVLDYALTLDLPDSGPTIHGNALLTVKRTAPADTLLLDFLDLDVNKVLVDNRPARFVRTPTDIAIVLPGAPKSGTTFHVDVDYHGEVRDGLIARRDSAGRWTYFGDNWPNRARHWIPSIDHPSDKATVTWRVRAPVGHRGSQRKAGVETVGHRLGHRGAEGGMAVA